MKVILLFGGPSQIPCRILKHGVSVVYKLIFGFYDLTLLFFKVRSECGPVVVRKGIYIKDV